MALSGLIKQRPGSAEAKHGVTVNTLSEMYLEIYESSKTPPAGKMQAIIGLAKLHGFI